MANGTILRCASLTIFDMQGDPWTGTPPFSGATITASVSSTERLAAYKRTGPGATWRPLTQCVNPRTGTECYTVSGAKVIFESVNSFSQYLVVQNPVPPPPTPTPTPTGGGGGGGAGGGGGSALPPPPPTFKDGAAAVRSIPENAAPGTAVGEPVTATSPYQTPVAYSLVGPDATFFLINRVTGQIIVGPKTILDYETKNKYTVIVIADGRGGSLGKSTVTIALANLNESGTLFIKSRQGLHVGTPVQVLLADPDGVTSIKRWQWERCPSDNPGPGESTQIQTSYDPGTDPGSQQTVMALLADTSFRSGAQRNFNQVEACANIRGAGSAAYTPRESDLGHQLRITVTYTDNAGRNNSLTVFSNGAVLPKITTPSPIAEVPKEPTPFEGPVEPGKDLQPEPTRGAGDNATPSETRPESTSPATITGPTSPSSHPGAPPENDTAVTLAIERVEAESQDPSVEPANAGTRTSAEERQGGPSFGWLVLLMGGVVGLCIPAGLWIRNIRTGK